MAGKLVIFWDFDGQWGAERSRAPGGEKPWGHLDFEHTSRLLELHARYAIPACFAVVGAAALPGERPRHDRDLVRQIARAGHEIASHSMYHEWLPALGYPKLVRSLIDSKEALQQATGCPVLSFVPPFNQPFDFLTRGSVSLSERRQAGKDRVDLGRLARALRETGYRFCRVSYAPLFERLLAAMRVRRTARPSFIEKINGLACLRLTARAGFGHQALQLLERCARQGGAAVVYGHPHSLQAGNTQDERYLVPFLERARQLIDTGQLQPVLPGRLAEEEAGMKGSAA
jgi:hypothetical protein